jgi:hypothetical protein
MVPRLTDERLARQIRTLRLVQEWNDYENLCRQLIPMLIKDRALQRDFMARLSCASTQTGPHIDSLAR